MVSRPPLVVAAARVRRAGVAAMCGAALVLTSGGIALAQPAYAPPGTGVTGSTVATEDRVAALEADYARATAQLAALQHAVSRQAGEYAAAAEAERVAADAAARAQDEADRATQAADAARDALSRFAAAAYEQGGVGHQGLLHLLTVGPGQALDMAQYLDDAAEAQDRQLREAQSLAGLADALRATAQEQARVRAERARALGEAHHALDAQVAVATEQVAQIGARQQALVMELALARQVTAEEQQRQLDARAQEGAARAQAAQAAATPATPGAPAAAPPPPAPPAPAPAPAPTVTTSAAPPAPSAPPSSPPAPTATPTPTPTPIPSPAPTTPATTPSLAWMQANPRTVAQQIMPSFGFGSDQWTCLNSLWEKESSWNWAADNPYSDAYGIPQSLPGSKMATAGADWLVNPATQIKWGLGYIKGRYGTPCAAWAAWQARSPHWY